MICVTALYRNTEGKHFDFDYYVNTHMPLAKERLSEFGLQKVEVLKGSEAPDGGPAPYVCIGLVEFSSLEGLKQGLEEHMEELLADVPNYTNIEPEIQINEVVATV